jgi:hypothetical protein
VTGVGRRGCQRACSRGRSTATERGTTRDRAPPSSKPAVRLAARVRYIIRDWRRGDGASARESARGEDPELRRWAARLGDAGEGHKDRRAAARARFGLGKKAESVREMRERELGACSLCWMNGAWTVQILLICAICKVQFYWLEKKMNRRGSPC